MPTQEQINYLIKTERHNFAQWLSTKIARTVVEKGLMGFSNVVVAQQTEQEINELMVYFEDETRFDFYVDTSTNSVNWKVRQNLITGVS